MDALNLMQVLKRRWILAVILLALVALGLTGLVRYTPAEYESTGVGLVIRQSQAVVDDSGRRDNPFAGIDNSLGVTATLLVTVITSPAVQEQLAERGLQGEVVVTNEGSAFDSESPFVSVTATANDPQTATTAVQLVLRRANLELVRQQNLVDGTLSERLTLLTVVPPPAGQLTRAGLLRAVGLAGVAGLAGALVLVVMADRLIEARRVGERQARAVRAPPSAPITRVTPERASGAAPPRTANEGIG